MATKMKKTVVGKKRALDEINPTNDVGQVTKKAKKQAPVNSNNKSTKKIQKEDVEELNDKMHDQDLAIDSDSELSVSDNNVNDNGGDEFQLGNLEIRVDRKTKQTVDEKLRQLQKSKEQTKQTTTGATESNKNDDGRGVIYIGHLPFGFFEQQLKGFFTQFGTVTRVRVSRNPKTGKSRHYGFVEFLERDVAAIAADTMEGYIMFGKRIVSKLMDPKDIKPTLFMGANRRLGLRPAPTRLRARIQYNKPKTAEQIDKNIQRLLKSEEKKRDKLKALGIDYEFPGFAAQANKGPKKIQFGYESDSEESDNEVEEKAPVKTPVKQGKTPVKAQEKTTPAKTQDKSPAKSAANGHAKTPAKTPVKAAEAKTPVKTPAKESVVEAKKTPAKSAASTPAKAVTTPAKPVAAEPKKSPAKSPAAKDAEKKTPATTPAKAAVKTPAKTPAKDVVEKKTPAKSPAVKKTPVKTPGKSPKK